MNWITSLARPTVKKTHIRADVPDDFWDRCPSCGTMLFHEEIAKSNFVCLKCGYHFRLPAKNRLEMLFDNEEYELLPLIEVREDPIRFSDVKKYTDRLKEARKKTDMEDAILTAYGKIDGHPAIICVFDFSFMGGSMGTFVGENIVNAAQEALKRNAALIILPASGGARMQEGMFSLIQMARTVISIKKLKEKSLPYITILTNPTTGGVTASFAMLGDVILAEPGAIIGFAGARVIEQTIHQKLPSDFQTAEYLFEHGMIDMVVPRKKIKAKVSQLLGLLGHS